jgi:UDP-galactopyranose mutase
MESLFTLHSLTFSKNSSPSENGLHSTVISASSVKNVDFAPGKEPYYPINDKRNTEMMSQYKKLASERKDVLFGGRLAQYAYADMDDTVAAALALCKKTFK